MTNEAKPSAPDFFNPEMARNYDDRNARLSAISDNMHFLIRLVLEDLPADARILCVGVGTGAEIVSLAQTNPGWSFVGIDPSASMLDVCREKLEAANILDRCELVHGYVQDAPEGAAFDAVVSVLVAHFIGREDRPDFYRAVHERLKQGGCFVSTEISADLDAETFAPLLRNWGRVQSLMGATPESLEKLPEMLRNMLSVVPPAETEALMKSAGFELPVAFFQAFMIRGWHASK